MKMMSRKSQIRTHFSHICSICPLGRSSKALFSIAYVLHSSEQITTHIQHGAQTNLTISEMFFPSAQSAYSSADSPFQTPPW